MAKILLVEDDKSLREIYGVRLMAEGYEIVSAGDGEEALAMAIKERPDLIVSDVMMPKISGFDMLDILRSTSETKDVKVIMMTALSSEDQRARGEALGADRYLVKSQVGIEDVVRTVHDVLGDTTIAAVPASATPAFTPAAIPVPAAPAPQPVAPTITTEPAPTAPVAPAAPSPVAPAPVFDPAPTAAPAPATPAPQPAAPAPVAPTPAPDPVQPATLPAQPVTPVDQATLTPAASTPTFATPAPQPVAPITPAPAEPAMPQPTAPFSTPAPASLAERVIQPLVNPDADSQTLNIAAQMEQALNNATPSFGSAPAPVAPTQPVQPAAPQQPQQPGGFPPTPPLN